ncbi:MAG: VOC family protein [Anaerolineae bacterium]
MADGLQTTTWQVIEARWPARVGATQVGYAALRRAMEGFLRERDVQPQAFCHVGVVVTNLDVSLARIGEALGERLAVRVDHVEAFAVDVARLMLEGVELEFVAPWGASFFAEALAVQGEGVQHLSFRVEEIERQLQRLAQAGVDLVDAEPRRGSHGKVAFSRPAPFAPLYLELTEPLE